MGVLEKWSIGEQISRTPSIQRTTIKLGDVQVNCGIYNSFILHQEGREEQEEVFKRILRVLRDLRG